MLRLLASGLSTSEVAALLGLARPTLKTHLATIRAKLGARSTAHALVLSERRGWTTPESRVAGAIEALAGTSAFLSDLATSLRHCVTFAEAWNVLNRRLADIGVHSANFALVAEPAGSYSNGAHMIAMSLPDEIRTLYVQSGGIASDPFARAKALGARFPWADARQPLPHGFPDPPIGFRRFREALCDHDITLTMSSMSRDSASGAPYGIAWNIHGPNRPAVQARAARMIALNRDVAELFWLMGQEQGFLRDRVAISVRQREALQNAARGFTNAESAERMGVSTRLLEKLLERARDAFGARTTAAAIFRAGVFRAIS